tara:strand:+ start:528 stop:2561 length:2034 start_codon:yes stop_codon:yes gene_type:complete
MKRLVNLEMSSSCKLDTILIIKNILIKINITFKSLSLFAVIIIFIYVWYGLFSKMPFLGDEFYTYDIINIQRPIPYHHIVAISLDLINLYSIDISFVRLTSLMFTILTMYIWIFHILKNKIEVLIFILIISSSPFIYSESLVFRYYSYYLFCSSAILLLLININYLSFKTRAVIMSFGVILSPFIFYSLNFLQFIYYLFYDFFKNSLFNKKIKYIFGLLIFLSALTITVYPQIVWQLFDVFNLNKQTEFDTSGEIRGLGFSTLIKPIYSLYNMILGYSVLPTTYLFIIPLFSIIFCIFLFLFKRLYYLDRHLFNIAIYSGVIPLFTVFYYFESFSFPGSMLLYAKHAMFFWTIIVLMFCKIYSLMNNTVSTIIIILLIFLQLFGLKILIEAPNEDWNKYNSFVSQNTNENYLIITDEISKNALFLNKTSLDNHINLSTYKQNIVKIDSFNEIVIAVRDYKLYEKLSLSQVWDYGKSTNDSFDNVNELIENLNLDFELVDSIVEWPVFLYAFKRKVNSELSTEAGFWGHHLSGLTLPTDNTNIVSSISIKSSESRILKPSDYIIINYEEIEDGKQLSKANEIIGFIECGKIKLNLYADVNIFNVFSRYLGKDKNIKDNNVALTWTHNPLLSSSITYPGSWFKHDARIYKFDTSICGLTNMTLSNISNGATIRYWTEKN